MVHPIQQPLKVTPIVRPGGNLTDIKKHGVPIESDIQAKKFM